MIICQSFYIRKKFRGPQFFILSAKWKPNSAKCGVKFSKLATLLFSSWLSSKGFSTKDARTLNLNKTSCVWDINKFLLLFERVVDGIMYEILLCIILLLLLLLPYTSFKFDPFYVQYNTISITVFSIPFELTRIYIYFT